MGILAMATFYIGQRVKEIGIRKVNGATEIGIVNMLNADLVKWVVLAFIVACPISYYAVNKWLENFPFKTSVDWWIYLASGLIAIFFAFITISWQSWRAASRNPVEALRYE
jgi:putative ABC transport system permease protein